MAFVLVLAPVVGVAAGLGGVALVRLIDFSHRLFFTDIRTALNITSVFYFILPPLIGSLLCGPLMFYFAPETVGSGITAVLRAVALRNGTIRPRVAIVKILASAICIGSGGSAGREGPIVQVGAAISSSLAHLLRLSPNQVRSLVACGVAGGISATFNAPLGGVFFAMEVILGRYGPRDFASIVMASVMSGFVTQFYLGRFPAFKVPAYEFQAAEEMPLYLVLGIVCALGGWLYVKTLTFTEDVFSSLRINPVLKPAVGGLLVGIMGFQVNEIFGDGYKTVEDALAGRLPLMVCLGLAFFKILATSATVGSGNAGGLYAPSLFIGALLGGAFGKEAYHFLPGVAACPGVFALVGMGALSAGVAQAPVSSIILLFEISGNYNVILPVMASSIVSTVLLRHWLKGSIFTTGLTKRGIDIWRYRGGDLMGLIPVSEATLGCPPILSPDMSIIEALNTPNPDNIQCLPVLDESGRIKGIAGRNSIIAASLKTNRDLKVLDVIETDFLISWPDETLREAAMKMDEVPYDTMLVVNRTDPRKLLGVITKTGILIAYHRRLLCEETLEGGVQDMTGWSHTELLGDKNYGIELPELVQEPGHMVRDSFILACLAADSSDTRKDRIRKEPYH